MGLRSAFGCAVTSATLFVACSGGSSPTPGPTAKPTATLTTPPGPTMTPTATPTPSSSPFACVSGGVASFNPACLIFLSPNAPPQSFTVSEAGYTGSFSVDPASTCLTHPPGSAAATISPMAGATTFTVTPGAATPQIAGTCSFSLLDANGQASIYNVAVTNTVVGGQ